MIMNICKLFIVTSDMPLTITKLIWQQEMKKKIMILSFLS